MLLYYFNKLSFKIKYEYTKEFGQMICYRSEGDQKINLYFVDFFFVEVWFSTKSKLLTDIQSFKTMDKLDPYLEKINISSLTEHLNG